MKRAIAYVRSAIADADALARQQTEIEAFCKDQGITLAAVEIDSGSSGMRMDRPGIKRLVKLIQDPEIGLIIMQDRTRLSRSLIYLAEYEELFRHYGKVVVYLSDKK